MRSCSSITADQSQLAAAVQLRLRASVILFCNALIQITWYTNLWRPLLGFPLGLLFAYTTQGQLYVSLATMACVKSEIVDANIGTQGNRRWRQVPH